MRVRLNSLYSQLLSFKLDALPSRMQYQSSYWFVIQKKIFFNRKLIINNLTSLSAWNVSKYGDFSGPYFPAIELNTERYLFPRNRTEYGERRSISPYSVRLRENTDQKKLRIWTFFTHCLWDLDNWMTLIFEISSIQICNWKILLAGWSSLNK